jgi:hypothetical protein
MKHYFDRIMTLIEELLNTRAMLAIIGLLGFFGVSILLGLLHTEPIAQPYHGGK